MPNDREKAERFAITEPALLPQGKTCSDCRHFAECSILLYCSGGSEVCDYSPSQFRQAPASVVG